MSRIVSDDPQIQAVQRQMQQDQQTQAVVQQMILHTAQGIFANMIAPLALPNGGATPAQLRQTAAAARDFAPYLAEAFGIIALPTPEQEEPNADAEPTEAAAPVIVTE